MSGYQMLIGTGKSSGYQMLIETGKSSGYQMLIFKVSTLKIYTIQSSQFLLLSFAKLNKCHKRECVTDHTNA